MNGQWGGERGEGRGGRERREGGSERERRARMEEGGRGVVGERERCGKYQIYYGLSFILRTN